MLDCNSISFNAAVANMCSYQPAHQAFETDVRRDGALAGVIDFQIYQSIERLLWPERRPPTVFLCSFADWAQSATCEYRELILFPGWSGVHGVLKQVLSTTSASLSSTSGQRNRILLHDRPGSRADPSHPRVSSKIRSEAKSH